MHAFLNCLLIILFFPSNVFSSEMNCKNVIEKDGIYYLKYTFIKYNGSCEKFDKNEILIQKQSFINGEKNGEFISYKNSMIIEKFYMKNNEPHGIYKSFMNEKLYKKVEYFEGEIKKCLIDISYIMGLEKEIIKLKKNIKSDEIYESQLKDLTDLVNTEKTNCDIKNLN